MAVTMQPHWTDNVAVITPQSLLKGNIKRVTLDLRTKIGARLFFYAGRGGTTVLTGGGGLRVGARKLVNQTVVQPGDLMWTGDTAAAILKLINLLAGYAAGVTAFAIDGTGTPAVDELYCLWGLTAVPGGNGTALSTCEFKRCAIGAAALITFDSPTEFAHADNEILTSKAWCFDTFVPGGSVYEVFMDYQNEASGEVLAIQCIAQTYDYDAKVTV